MLKRLCKDSKQHNVMFHQLYSVSLLLCIAQNVRFEIPYKVIFNNIQILCLGVLWLLARKKLSAHFVVERSLTIFGRSRYVS